VIESERESETERERESEREREGERDTERERGGEREGPSLRGRGKTIDHEGCSTRHSWVPPHVIRGYP
jgi:hypothetical protein